MKKVIRYGLFSINMEKSVVRIEITGQLFDEFSELKNLIGTSTDTETIRVIIHNLYVLRKNDIDALKKKKSEKNFSE